MAGAGSAFRLVAITSLASSKQKERKLALTIFAL
jgi:hypothetical protein